MFVGKWKNKSRSSYFVVTSQAWLGAKRLTQSCELEALRACERENREGKKGLDRPMDHKSPQKGTIVASKSLCL